MALIGTEIVIQKLEAMLRLHLWQRNEHTHPAHFWAVREFSLSGGRSECRAQRGDTFISTKCPITTWLGQELVCGDLSPSTGPAPKPFALSLAISPHFDIQPKYIWNSLSPEKWKILLYTYGIKFDKICPNACLKSVEGKKKNREVEGREDKPSKQKLLFSWKCAKLFFLKIWWSCLFEINFLIFT